MEISLRDNKTQWAVRFLALSFIVLCTNVLRDAGGPRALHFQVLNGFIIAIILNASLIVALTKFGVTFRRLIILPLMLSGLGVGFVMWNYHILCIPLVLILHIWVGYRLFKEVEK